MSNKITSALELFKAAVSKDSYLTPEIVRCSSRNHFGHSFNNRAQFIAMEADGRVFTYGINPHSLISGRATEGQAIKLEQVSGGFWDADCGTVFDFVGKIDPDGLDWSRMIFPIDDNFTEVERIECTCCNGNGYYTDQSQDAEGITMKPDQITNALELFNAANDYPGKVTAKELRNESRNHQGFNFTNRAQFLAMDNDGQVFAYGLNPASLIDGDSKEGDKVEMELDRGIWCAVNGTVARYIGTLKGELRELITHNAACFPIDDNFAELESFECACCNGHGCVAEQIGDEHWADIQCPDCLGSGSVPNGKV